jgi:hypothetical protein
MDAFYFMQGMRAASINLGHQEVHHPGTNCSLPLSYIRLLMVLFHLIPYGIDFCDISCSCISF